MTTTGGVAAVASTTSPAAFVGAGTRKTPVQIRLPKNPITLTSVRRNGDDDGSKWTLDGASTRQINTFEAFQFQVGGTLNVRANQVPGTYVGTFSVTVQYP